MFMAPIRKGISNNDNPVRSFLSLRIKSMSFLCKNIEKTQPDQKNKPFKPMKEIICDKSRLKKNRINPVI